MKPILDVLNAVKPSRRPMWIMRQAGRYLPEYREVRAQAGSFLKLCYDPKLACEVTLQPLRRFDFDAAILFSDILVVPHAMGLGLDFKEGEGPQLETVESLSDVELLSDGLDSDHFERVWETVGLVKASLTPQVALIGFCGAPWTVASYMIEGGSSKREKALSVARQNPEWFQVLIQRLVETSITYLLGQIKAGAETIQIFDSWAGDVPEGSLQRVVIDPISAIIKGVRAVYPGFPVIVFARGVGAAHGLIAQATGANAVGLEENVSAAGVLKTLPAHVAVQGNLSNQLLLGDEAAMVDATRRILESVPAEQHIFNLGHGIMQQTPVSAVERLVKAVRDFG
ncbi:uroporphyrinogen decarboxylase [Aestuariivirga litoralis]|uniref:uroporphyrinogen decarboxylase n=1 Tax=Aestuariivirga litoralis TaxID=2650924 RepID=UPI0018C5EFD9|nr:uroporphyrinogen decarboxylase [Aestuariivirga litoralis]MBG1233774.1 uroporphyrinogen decarboxylase [Aestuariivirga litoralis]